MQFYESVFAEQNELFWPQICKRTAEFAEKNTSTTAKSAKSAMAFYLCPASLSLCGDAFAFAFCFCS
jgi:hypothetical protein